MEANKSLIEQDGSMMQQNSKKTGLLSIPNEIISHIGGYLTSDHDIAAFARTCKLFNIMFGDALYQRNEMYNGASCLTWAASHDRVETLERAAKAGIRLEDHSYLVFVVSCHGSREVAKLVLSMPGIDPMAEDGRGWTPITLAASYGHTNVIRVLVDNGADIRTPTRSGWSPINVACSHGSIDVAKLLLEGYGASMESDEENGWSPLRSASVFGHANILCYLIRRGADISERSATGWTCLHSAAEAGHTRAVAELLDHGLDPMALTDMGWTPMILAADKGHDDVVHELLDRGVDIEQACRNLWTPLCMAASRGDYNMCGLLLSRGANIAARAMGGWFPLALAASNGHDPAVSLLIGYGADIHMTNDNGWTPVMAAADNGHSSTAMILIDKGAEVEARSTNGWTALMCAADGRHLHTAKLLLGYGAKIMATSDDGCTAGIRAAHSGGIRLLNMFRRIPGFELDHLDNQGRSAFFHAAMRGHARLVKKLLPLVSTANKRDQYGTTPVFAAARNGHRKVVEVLIKEGYADFDERDFLGCTLLAWAQRSKRRQFVRFLKKHAQKAGIPIWLEDPVGKRTQFKYDCSMCLCSICCRTSPHLEQAYVCEDCNGGMLICAECIDAGMTCEDSSHTWRAHQCFWNHDYDSDAPEYLAASASVRSRLTADAAGGIDGFVAGVEGQ
ncbi:Ankyrin repeat domain-containing protein 50 [Trichoderma ghanense]|uniref:Ankyrin repeat domain-containing protein 50 n=1 Tax=Trichoderma ghanense TaxID=65468 RepID=A0ABY2GSX5_9HYPO